jgi:hypothetical protein
MMLEESAEKEEALRTRSRCFTLEGPLRTASSSPCNDSLLVKVTMQVEDEDLRVEVIQTLRCNDLCIKWTVLSDLGPWFTRASSGHVDNDGLLKSICLSFDF